MILRMTLDSSTRSYSPLAKVVGFDNTNGDINLADMVSKHWGYLQIWDMFRSLLIWRGDTITLGQCEMGQD